MPDNRFWKMSLKAKPIATDPIPNAPMSLPGVKLGTAIIMATIKPKNKISALPTRLKTVTKF